MVDKVGRNLHKHNNHPLGIIKTKIEHFMNSYASKTSTSGIRPSKFDIYDSFSPLVDVKSCFDDLRVPKDHVSRRPSDTYYITDKLVLRTHTSAHQTQLLRQGVDAFLCSGDVFRRDEIDATHYPVFHQMEGVRLLSEDDVRLLSVLEQKKLAELDLKEILSALALDLFGDVEMRWKEDYFPFTEPSFELEVKFNGNWLEVLGCGVIHNDVLSVSGRDGRVGWAFGLGLERLAMILFGIPDIRLFWSQDERFTSQFKKGVISKFVPYSKYPLCYKDVSFWLPENKSSVHVNDIYEIIREVGGDLVEKVHIFDEFINKKTGLSSQAYRITYRHMDRNLTNEEVDKIQWLVRENLVTKLKVTLR